MSIYDKLAKALAHRKYSFSGYMKAHGFGENEWEKAREAWLDCKFYSNQFAGLSNEDIEVLLDNQPIG